MSWISNISTPTQQVTQGLFSATKLLESDDAAIIKKVQKTHKPHGRQVDNLGDLFSIIGKILLHDNRKSDDDVPNEKSVALEVPAYLINKICCKLACNCTDRDAQETTMTILEKELQNYLWDEKLVIMAAAFAVNYGEFYLLTQLDTPDPVAKNMAFLKQLQFIKEIGSASQNLSGAINELSHAIMTVIKIVLQFSDLDPKYFEAEKQPSAITEIARATYWTIYSVVTCGSYIAALVGLRNHLDVWDVEMKALAKLYLELQTKEHNRYQIVWLPIVDEFNEHKFSSLQSLMPWYTVRNPKILRPGFIRYIRESKPGSIICLYGGEDIKWIEDFTTMINRVKDFTKTSIDLVYVSKSNAIDHYNNAIFDFITAKKVGGYWKADETHNWHFWTRLESIFSWGIRDGKNAKENDTMKDVMSLLSFNDSYKGWAVFGQFGSSHKVAKATGEVIMDVLLKISNWWKAGTNVDSFVIALNQQIEHLKVQKHHCYHIVLPATFAKVPDEMMICPICDRKMGKYPMYRCCE
ncbi:hypothetical protein P3X46_017997 [Hevea brasiliensis]|uniref:Sieve element occlusion N-terminal domain-containing protein n=1 Tax=Hevea brasiliensis TaxID=3981 RepID=A0ABQ9LQL4_HEVBR|nr:hypothetical protein P3X46_017997 [Hevea brasiliensis]